MNVYFCDVCGVRVTDLDLHSGHGMRRRNDVICAACLELGHGKGWVANHAQKQQMAFAGAAAAVGIAPIAPGPAHDAGEANEADEASHADAGPGDDHDHPAEIALRDHPAERAAAPPAPPELELDDETSRRSLLAAMATPPPALDMARDRLRTLDDDQPPSKVAAIQLDPEPSDLELPAPTALGEPTADDTAKVAVLHQELSTAAAGFAALNPPAQDHPAAADDLDEEHVASGIDDSGAQAEIEGEPAEGATAEKAETASNMPITEVPTAASRAKSAVSSNRTARGRTNATPSSSRNGTASSSSTSAPSSTSSRSSKVSKSSKSTKSSKSRSQRRAKPGYPPVVVLSAISLVAILFFGSIGIYRVATEAKPAQQTIEVKLGEQLQAAVKDAKAAATTALDNPTIDGLEAAKAKIRAVQDLAAQFSDEAQKGTNGAKVWSEDDVDRQMETWGIPDLISLMKNINDREDIIKGNESH